MEINLHHFRLLTVLLALGMVGCGSEPPARQDILDQPAEELHGAATKGMLYEFRAKVRKHGVEGARQELPILLENFENYEQAPVGQDLDLYKQINDKLMAFQTTLGGSPDNDAVVQAVEEIGVLADLLPGEAEENPQVE